MTILTDLLVPPTEDASKKSRAGAVLSLLGIALTVLYFAYSFYREYNTYTSTSYLRQLGDDGVVPVKIECVPRCVILGSRTAPYGHGHHTATAKLWE